MKKLAAAILCTCLIAVFSQTAQAKPANPNVLHTATQDGYTFRYTAHGDEYLSWCRAEDGTTIVNSNGNWYFAKLINGIAVKSAETYNPKKTAPSFALKNYVPSASAVKRINDVLRTHTSSVKSAAEEPQKPERWEPAETPLSGDKKALFIRVSFTDTRTNSTFNTVTSSEQVEALWQNGDNKFNVQQYYLDQSKQQMKVVPFSSDIQIIEIHTTSQDFTNLISDDATSVDLAGKHPGNYIRFKGVTGDTYKIRAANEAKVITELMKRAKEQAKIKFSDYAVEDKEDTNYKFITSDTLLVYFLFEGIEDAENGGAHPQGIWAHQGGSYYTSADKSQAVILSNDVAGDKDVMLSKWAMNGEIGIYDSGERAMPIAATVCHEMGHQLCDLPDLYDTSSKNLGMGGFSLMAGGTSGAVSGDNDGSRPVNLDAWSRYYLGWEKPIVVNSRADLELKRQSYDKGSEGTAYLIKGPSSQPYQYYLAEVRDPADKNTWDGGLQNVITESGDFKPGVLVIHVDERVGSGALAYGNDINQYLSDDATTVLNQHQGVMGVWSDRDSRKITSKESASQLSLWYKGNGAEGIFPNAAKDFLRSLFFSTKNSAAGDVNTGIKLFNFSESSTDMTASLDYESTDNGNSGGCSAGFAAIALLAAIPVVLKRKK